MNSMHHTYVPRNLMRLSLSDGNRICIGSLFELERHCLTHIFSAQLPDGSFVAFDERLIPRFARIFDLGSWEAKARVQVLASAVCERFQRCEEFFATLSTVSINLDDGVEAPQLGGLKTAVASPLDRNLSLPATMEVTLTVDVDVLLDAGEYVLGDIGIDSNRFVYGSAASPRFPSLKHLEYFCAANLSNYEAAGTLMETHGRCPSMAQWSTLLCVPVEAMSHRST